MPATLTFTGVDELLKALERLAPDLTAEAGPLEAAIAEAAADKLRAAVPVVTGRLRRSIQVARTNTQGTRVYTTVVMAVPYAHIVEYGGRYVRARPAFVPITRRARDAFVTAVVDRVREKGLTVKGAP